jgi:hypothetical protein
MASAAAKPRSVALGLEVDCRDSSPIGACFWKTHYLAPMGLHRDVRRLTQAFGLG